MPSPPACIWGGAGEMKYVLMAEHFPAFKFAGLPANSEFAVFWGSSADLKTLG